MMFDWILTNKEILKVLYALVVVSICGIIVLKTDRMFKLSDHQGLRYFRNAFLFYGLAFFSRFILGKIKEVSAASFYFLNIKFFFEFFIIIAGFFLLYSLAWKYVEKEKNHHSLLNWWAGIFYVLALLMVVLDLYFNIAILMYSSQIILFALMGIISYSNFSRSGGFYKFLGYYFVVIMFGLFGWILNALLEYFFNWNKVVQILIYIINFLFFVFFLYAIKKMTKNKDG